MKNKKKTLTKLITLVLLLLVTAWGVKTFFYPSPINSNTLLSPPYLEPKSASNDPMELSSSKVEQLKASLPEWPKPAAPAWALAVTNCHNGWATSLGELPAEDEDFSTWILRLTSDPAMAEEFVTELESWSIEDSGSKVWRLHRRIKDDTQSLRHEWLLYDLDEEGYPQSQGFFRLGLQPDSPRPLIHQFLDKGTLIEHHRKAQLHIAPGIHLEWETLNQELLQFYLSHPRGHIACEKERCRCF